MATITRPTSAKCLACAAKCLTNDEGYFSDINGSYVCKQCCERQWTCSFCMSFTETGKFNITADNTILCNTCYRDKTLLCENCGKDFPKNNIMITPQLKRYCKKCFYDNYYKCRGCDTTFDRPAFAQCSTCNKDFCPGCFEEHITQDICSTVYNRRSFSDHKFKGIKDTCKYIFHDRYVGVEIEAENGKRGGIDSLLPFEVGVTGDGSLNDTGIEIQTPPASLSQLERLVTGVCAVMKKRGFKGTISCGLHVHMDASDIKKDPIIQKHLVQFFFATEDLLYSMLPTSRWGGHYSQMLNHQYVYDLFKKIKGQRGFEKVWYKNDSSDSIDDRKNEKYDSTRYFGLNVHSIFYRGTVEFRYHSGTVEEKKILSWASILLYMLDYIVNNFDEDQVAKLYDMPTSLGKLEYFWKVIGLPDFLREYMHTRIQKFNPNFEVQFNKGKAFREMDEEEKKKIIKKIEKLIEARTKIELKILKKTKDMNEFPPLRDLRYISLATSTYDQATYALGYMGISEIATRRAKAYILKKYPSEYEVAFPSKDYADKGFMKEKELNDKVTEINKKDKNREVEGEN